VQAECHRESKKPAGGKPFRARDFDGRPFSCVGDGLKKSAEMSKL
jgi:hypothetical protein